MKFYIIIFLFTYLTLDAQSNKSNNVTNIKVPFVGKRIFDFYYPASGSAPTYYVSISANGLVKFTVTASRFSNEHEVVLGYYKKIMDISKFQKIREESYCKITKDSIFLTDKFGNRITKEDCCKMIDKEKCLCASKLSKDMP